MFIDAFELLSDDQLLIPGMEGHFGLSGEDASCGYENNVELKRNPEPQTSRNPSMCFHFREPAESSPTKGLKMKEGYDELHMPEA